MADEPDVRVIAATSEEFRKLARSTGKTLDDETGEDMRSNSKTPFLLIDIEQHEDTLQHVIELMKQFELHEFKRLHPGKRIRWHKCVHVKTNPVPIDESTFGETEEDLLTLPLFFRRAEDQEQIGQPSSPKANFKILEGDILLFYKSLDIS